MKKNVKKIFYFIEHWPTKFCVGNFLSWAMWLEQDNAIAPITSLKIGNFYLFKTLPGKLYEPPLRNGSPVWRLKSMKNSRTKMAQQAANDPVWISQALKPLCLIQFWGWMNPLFPLSALWGNRIGLPVWKWKYWKISRTKWAQWAANGPVWVAHSLKLPVLSNFEVGWIHLSYY